MFPDVVWVCWIMRKLDAKPRPYVSEEPNERCQHFEAREGNGWCKAVDGPCTGRRYKVEEVH